MGARYPREMEYTENQVIARSISNGLAALRRAGVSFADIHAGNVRKDAEGRYTILDIGRSLTGFPEEPEIIERLHIDGDLNAQLALIERITG
jgi:hypothetical protein